jgi:hypothetical protein
MNRYTTIALLGAVFAVSITVLNANGIIATPFSIADTVVNTMDSGMDMKGHVTIAVYNPDGTIKAYRQMDNIVVDTGKTCTGAKLFGSVSGECQPNTYNFIAIGIGTGTDTTSSLTSIQNQLGSRVQDTSNVLTNSTGTGATSSLSSVFSSFTSSSAIAESGLYDAASGGHMFARKGISPVVNVQSGDSLTVTWTITTGS